MLREGCVQSQGYKTRCLAESVANYCLCHISSDQILSEPKVKRAKLAHFNNIVLSGLNSACLQVALMFDEIFCPFQKAAPNARILGDFIKIGLQAMYREIFSKAL